MKESPIIIPDSSFIEQFKKEERPKEAGPTVVRVDGHVDLPHYLMSHEVDQPFSKLSEGPFTLQKAKAAGIRLFCTALYCNDRYNGEGSEGHYQEILDLTLRHLDTVQVVTQKDHLKQLWEDENLICTILLLENADFLATSSELITQIVADGIRIVGLTHAGKNRLGDGNAVAFPDGLTDKGKEVAQALHQNNVIIDTAHLHPRSFWQLLDVSEGPLICSHTGVREVYNIPRNVGLDQVKEILQRQGVIGISLNPEMLWPEEKVDVETVFVHVDTIVQKYGAEAVGIGSDLGGFEKAPEALREPGVVEKLEGIMRSHGYDEKAVEAITGGNWLRFFEQNL
ncbi:MAG: membrane dipeptidase [Deltaproteobacteria bacterium]|nr:membrane dipeptidase [Deltaproteobacteria bacterium]MBW1927552.1 membrane dipeptidase [Deltaproteobacteria bacterium]MBW2026522.1 membrane dipeptidase [Deltaproteobacteria bacterium]MBW2124813.1 membrane dipeptidase [Deltaproteobacteria bacterium]RLB22492.1 MAG: hypothetical protein DRG76_06555 [Deltaproteobacteria bacterium]